MSVSVVLLLSCHVSVAVFHQKRVLNHLGLNRTEGRHLRLTLGEKIEMGLSWQKLQSANTPRGHGDIGDIRLRRGQIICGNGKWECSDGDEVLLPLSHQFLVKGEENRRKDYPSLSVQVNGKGDQIFSHALLLFPHLLSLSVERYWYPIRVEFFQVGWEAEECRGLQKLSIHSLLSDEEPIRTPNHILFYPPVTPNWIPWRDQRCSEP